MQECYADNAVFNDEIFTNLGSKEVRAMWEMLCINGNDLKLEFRNILAGEKTATAEWTACYTFPATGRKVVNHVKADFFIEQGKIIKHTDIFSFYQWAKQSLGLMGVLFGWTWLVKNKIRTEAARKLNDYIYQKMI